MVYFPLGSNVFSVACEEGIYEQSLLNLILSIVEPATAYIDVGANIGLLSVPVLAQQPLVTVVSIEPSPNTLPYLKKTHKAARRNDWTIIEAAVGDCSGDADFWRSAPAYAGYDGLRNTGRGGPKYRIRVPLRTLDDIWMECGSPRVSVIKMDIEGGEYMALAGAKAIIARDRPSVIIEWTEKNLLPCGISPEAILAFCRGNGYSLHSIGSLVPIETQIMLKFMMSTAENFILIPRES